MKITNKKIGKLLLSIAFLCLATLAKAYSFSSNGLYYNITSSSTGSSAVYVAGVYSFSGSSISIPSIVSNNGYTYEVIGIGNNAFANHYINLEYIESLSIPSSITYIGYNAFDGCTGLKEIYCGGATPPTLDSNSFTPSTFNRTVVYVYRDNICNYLGNPDWSKFRIITAFGTFTSSGNFFYSTSNTTAAVAPWFELFWNWNYYKYHGNVTIPQTAYDCDNYNGKAFTVSSVGPYAFHDCDELTSVSLPETVINISEHSFNNCTGLKSVSMQSNLSQIGKYAFNNCSRLYSISLPSALTKISEYTFNECTSLTNVYFPNNLQDIGEYAFNKCSSLTRINLPNSLTRIGNGAFYECTGLVGITLPNNIVSIGENVFSGCTGLSSITIPNSVNTIGLNAFYNCSNLDSASIGNSVTSIGSKAFYGCSALSDIHCKAETPPAIEQNTFSETTYSLASLRVPASSLNSYRTANHWKKFFHIMVDGVLATSVSLDASSASLYKNETLMLNATVLPSNADYKSVTWTSSNPSVATVSSNGLVTAKSIGTAMIVVKTDDGSNLTDTCYLQVKQRLATSISLNKSSATLYTNETLQLSATVLPSNADDKSVMWTSSNPSVATVTSSGLVTAVSAGSATITASTADGSNLSASCSITVKQLATSISLNTSSATLFMGSTLQLTETIMPSNTSDKSVSWTSSNTDVAIVSPEGLVTPVSTGTAVITVKTEDGSDLTARCVVTVKQLATSISLSETDVTICTGNTLQLTATVLPSTTSNPSVTWSSSNTSVATVSSTGLVTAKSAGNAVITAKTSDGTNLSATCNITVKRLATSITLNKTSATLYLDQTLQLSATVSPSNATDKSVVWSSSNNRIATVSSTGLVTAIATGITTITATTTDGSDLSATCEITVNAYVTSLTLDQSEVTILEGDTITLTPTILPTYATNQTIYWSSNNTGVATVSNGVVIGRSGGETTITARTADGTNLYAYCQVKVIPNFDLSMPDFSHIRGSANNKYDLTVDLANRYDITGMQFDIQFPDGVTIAKDNDGEYDILLDDTRKTRNHTATASLIGNNTYRILVSSATANSLKGHSGTVVHIMIEIPLYHVSGNKQVKYTNIILSEPDETRHTLQTKYSMISYYYKEGDANADVNVDVADYVITGNYILQNSPENFWYDAANVDHNSTIDVNDLTGITNIALGRREGGILQMPAIQQTPENDIELSAEPLDTQKGQTKTLDICLNEIYAFAGFQMDMQLPEGLRLVDASLIDGDSGLNLATAELADGSIRLLASSFSLKDLSVNNSSFLRITVSAEDEIGTDGKIILNDIKFSKRNMTLHTIDHYEIPVGNGVSGLEQVYSRIRIYPEGKSIIIDSPESGTARIVTISGISQFHDVQPGHNVIPMDDVGLYLVTLNGTTAKLYLK